MQESKPKCSPADYARVLRSTAFEDAVERARGRAFREFLATPEGPDGAGAREAIYARITGVDALVRELEMLAGDTDLTRRE